MVTTGTEKYYSLCTTKFRGVPGGGSPTHPLGPPLIEGLWKINTVHNRYMNKCSRKMAIYTGMNTTRAREPRSEIHVRPAVCMFV